MKFLLLCTLFIANYTPNVFAHEPLSIVKSIDDFDLPTAANDASELALPHDFTSIQNFTPISDARARDLFHQLERNPKARNRIAGGKCAIRRNYIQGYLRRLGISSGRLYIQCPSNRGHMRLIDQVTGHRYTFANFHDVNLLSVQGSGYQVFDVQFENRPMTLSSYLAQVEASQKLKPLKNRTTKDRGYCYWSIR
jgi:hypothetical protein